MLRMRRSELFLSEILSSADGFNGNKAWQPSTENKQKSNHSADLLQIWDHASDLSPSITYVSKRENEICSTQHLKKVKLANEDAKRKVQVNMKQLL